MSKSKGCGCGCISTIIGGVLGLIAVVYLESIGSSIVMGEMFGFPAPPSGSTYARFIFGGAIIATVIGYIIGRSSLMGQKTPKTIISIIIGMILAFILILFGVPPMFLVIACSATGVIMLLKKLVKKLKHEKFKWDYRCKKCGRYECVCICSICGKRSRSCYCCKECGKPSYSCYCKYKTESISSDDCWCDENLYYTCDNCRNR